MSSLAPLAAWPQFIVCKLVPLADGRTDKIPCDYRTGHEKINYLDPQYWTDWQSADAIATLWGESFRVGFVLAAGKAPVWVLDIDGALTPQGTWSTLAHQLLAALPGTAVEISQSGKGLHIWGQGPVPAHSKRNHPLHIELYSDLRYICLGRWREATGDMTQPCPQIAAVAAAYFPPRAAGAHDHGDGPVPEWSGPTDDEQLIERALNAAGGLSAVFGKGATFRDLWDADADALARAWPSDGDRPYDASSADAALAARLAYWTGKDHERIERLMKRSALVRDKWDRADYLTRTIDGACGLVRDVLKDKAPVSPAGLHVIRSDDILGSARGVIEREFAHPDGPTLRRWQGEFYRWALGAWSPITGDDLTATLYRVLDQHAKAMFAPTRDSVGKLTHALGAEVHVGDGLRPPCWIDGRADPKPSETVACSNGLLHMPSRRIIEATPSFFGLNGVPHAYDPHAAPPAAWLKFLESLWPDDRASIDCLQEIAGYLLTPDTSRQKAFCLIGPKRAGKGTIGDVLRGLLGPDNVASPSLSSLGSEFGLQPLMGKLAAIISDARLGGRADAKAIAENLLRISGEDAVDVNRKFLSPVSLRLPVRFLMLTNEHPKFTDASGALASRFVILRLSRSFYGAEDHGLRDRLQREFPGVLKWAVEGWHRLHARGSFLQPLSALADVEALADLGSPVAAFIRDVCDVRPEAEIARDTLYRLWRAWCSEQGVDRPTTANVFGGDLRAALPNLADVQPRGPGGDRYRAYRGIGVAPGTRWHRLSTIPTTHG